MRCLLLALALSLAPQLAHADGTLLRGSDALRAVGMPGIRGITVGPIESSQHPGRGYGSEASLELVEHLADMGATWISITPFGRIWSLSSTEILMDFEAPYEDNRAGIARMVAQAHARGLKVLLIPHLWVETSGWRGEIDPGSPAGWKAYQASYRDFLLRWVRDAEAAGVDALSIGVECKSWSDRFGPYWESLIAEVRANFSGALTYSANWDEAEAVLFWDLLDFVGINAFYPLSSEGGASDHAYREGARRWIEPVRTLATRFDRPVLFVELGYTTRRDAAIEPWLWPDGMEGVVIDEHEQARALAAMIEAFTPEPWFAGFFVWRYYANLDDVSQEAEWGFSPHAKQASAILEAAFKAPWGADPSPFAWERPPSWALPQALR